MQNKKKILKEYKLIIFDVDGVLINSEKNMLYSWRQVCKKFKLKISFDKYKKNVGLPFQKILNNLKIKNKNKNIEKFYKKQTIKNLSLIKLYPGIKKLILLLKRKKILISIVTSKDKVRTQKILKKLRINIKDIYSPKNIRQGKPSKYLINKCIKKNKILKKNTCYIGDTRIDYLASIKSGVDFIFHEKGFGEREKMFTKSYSKISDLKKILNV